MNKIESSTCGTTVKHRFILDVLMEEIANGKYEPLGPFPSERALMRRFDVARETVRRVVRMLQRKGLVYRRHGRGTFISPHQNETIQPAPVVVRHTPKRKIGVIVSGCRYTEIFPRICAELKCLARKQGLTLLMGDASAYDSDEMGASVYALAQEMVMSGVSGIILQPLEYGDACSERNKEILNLFRRENIPVVLIDSDVDRAGRAGDCDIVGIDNYAAGATVAHHLLECGARHIRFLVHNCLAESIRERWFGCRSESGEIAGNSPVRVNPADVRAVSDWLANEQGLDAVICQNDVAAVKLIATLRKIGRRVPADVMVAGFDDVSFASCVTPSLTTIHQPCEAIAAHALKTLVDRMAHPDASACRHQLRAPLVVRHSTEARSLAQSAV